MEKSGGMTEYDILTGNGHILLFTLTTTFGGK